MGLYDRDTLIGSTKTTTFSSRVYGWMSMGLGVTAVVAYALYKTGIYAALMPFWWVWSIGLFGVAIALNTMLPRLTTKGAIGLFLTYAGLEGLLFGTILPAFAASYGGGVIWAAFATGALIFAIATGYGVFTKADLTGLGKILTIGLIGLAAVTFLFFILSFFLPLQGLHLIISYIGLILFVGLTAYDAQTIRQYSLQAEGNSALSTKLSLIMALRMYVNVIMIFWYLLQIFASSSKR